MPICQHRLRAAALALLLASGFGSSRLGAAGGDAPAFLNIQTIEGSEAVHTAGSRSASPLVVQVTDGTGKPVSKAAVTFLMPSNGPGGIFASGLSTEVLTTGADGTVSVRGIRWGRQAGQVRIRITAAKGRFRAGAIVTQFLQPGDAGHGMDRRGFSVSKPKKKWVAIAVIAAGAAAGGLAIGLSGSGAAASEPPAASGAVSTGPAVQVGAPTITIGQP